MDRVGGGVEANNEGLWARAGRALLLAHGWQFNDLTVALATAVFCYYNAVILYLKETTHADNSSSDNKQPHKINK